MRTAFLHFLGIQRVPCVQTNPLRTSTNHSLEKGCLKLTYPPCKIHLKWTFALNNLPWNLYTTNVFSHALEMNIMERFLSVFLSFFLSFLKCFSLSTGLLSSPFCLSVWNKTHFIMDDKASIWIRAAAENWQLETSRLHNMQLGFHMLQRARMDLQVR